MRYLALLCLIASLVLTGCDPKASDSRPRVVSTIGMIHDLVLNIGKEHVNAESLMGPGIDPHLYKASESDVRLLHKADLIVYNGLHLESKMIDIFKKMATSKQIVAVTDGIDRTKLLASPDYDDYHDPHVWFDVRLWILAAEQVTDALIRLIPDQKAALEANAAAYIAELNTLDTYVRSQIASVPKAQRVLITAHDAFGYFGNAYGFEVVGLQGISTEAEAGTKDVQRLTNMIVQRQIPAIFVESSVPVRHIKAVQAGAKAKGVSVEIGGELYADAMGDADTPEGTYVGMVKHNVNTIVDALLIL